MSDTIPLTALMANLSAELQVLTRRCHAVEDLALSTLRPQQGGLSSDLLMGFQHLDQLTQVLADLVRLFEADALNACAEGVLDRARVRQALTMTSLADRLLNEGAPEGEPHRAEDGVAADFLL